MYNYIKEIIKQIGSVFYTKELSNTAIELVNHLEDDELSKRLLMKLNGVNSREDLIEKEKIKYQLLVQQIIDTWNSRNSNSNTLSHEFLWANHPYVSTLMEVTLVIKAGFDTVYRQTTNVEVGDSEEIKTMALMRKEIMYREAFDGITANGVAWYLDQCKERQERELEQKLKQIETIEKYKQKLLNDSRQAEVIYLEDQRRKLARDRENEREKILKSSLMQQKMERKPASLNPIGLQSIKVKNALSNQSSLKPVTLPVRTIPSIPNKPPIAKKVITKGQLDSYIARNRNPENGKWYDYVLSSEPSVHELYNYEHNSHLSYSKWNEERQMYINVTKNMQKAHVSQENRIKYAKLYPQEYFTGFDDLDFD